MSGNNVGGVVGTFELLEYRGTRYDPLVENLAKSLSKGTSVTHSAARLTFKADALNTDYIKRLEGLNALDPNRVVFKGIKDREGNLSSYELYYSFWPKEDWKPVSTGSRLAAEIDDGKISELGSPFTYSEKGKQLVNPHKEVVQSSISIFKHLLPAQTITLVPSITLHLTPLEHKFGGTAKELAMDYDIKYETWRRLSIENKSQEQIKNAHTQMIDSQNLLQAKMFPDSKMTPAQFMIALEPYATFGNTARDSVSIPIATAAQGNKDALVLEKMIDRILDVGEHPNNHRYNLIDNNCANQTLAAMQAGIPDGASAAFKAAISPLTLAPELGFALPGEVERDAAKLSKVIDAETDGLPATANKEITGRGMHHLGSMAKLQPSLAALKRKNDNDDMTQKKSAKRAAKPTDIPNKPIPPFVQKD